MLCRKLHSYPSPRKKDARTVPATKLTYQIVSLRNDKEESVYVDEVQNIDFGNIMNRLKRGESVFIASRTDNQLQTSDNSRLN